MGYPCSKTHSDPKNCWDWGGGVIEVRGTEVGVEDLTIEFPPHSYTHHNGQGFNGIYLYGCTHCWVKNVRILNADDAVGITFGHHNTIDGVETTGGYHVHFYMSATQQNLVTNIQFSGGSFHGLSGVWDTHGGVFSNGWGNPVIIEPDHNGPTTTGLLYSNIQGTGGQASKMSDTFLWNYMNQKLCPLDIHQAQLARRLGTQPPSAPDTWRVNAGGGFYTDGDGNLWAADRSYSPGMWGYVGGTTYSTRDPIANTTDDALYQSERYGNFSYKFDIPNGEYDVTLYFAEIYWNASGKRLFDIYIEGTRVLASYDIYAGNGHDVAAVVVVPGVMVADKQLRIDFVTLRDNAKISAIEIQPAVP
jgi:hypothetical protein